jgi:hypothetical protein
MNVRTSSLAFFAFLLSAHLVPAEIDSGGGKSSDGQLFNHSSIGSPFATFTTAGCPISNHPGLIEVLYPELPDSLTDSDSSGLPDAWEMQHFQHLGVDPTADEDHDGTTNLMEYLAGTDPNSSSCFFRPQGTYTGGIFQMPIQTISGRNYKIWVSRDLQQWTLQSTFSGNNSQQLFQFDETTIASASAYAIASAAGKTITVTYCYSASGISGALAAGAEQWLELTVDSVEQSPRQKLLAVPVAMNAQMVENASGVLEKQLNDFSKDVAHCFNLTF